MALFRNLFVWSVLAFLLPAAEAADADDCDLPQTRGVVFLPHTTAPTNLLPPLEKGQQLPRDCEFYRWAWQTFLFSTSPSRQSGYQASKAAFLGYPSFEDVFAKTPAATFPHGKPGMLALGPRTLFFSTHPHDAVAAIEDIRQANVNSLLVDQHGNAVFYALHMNPTYVHFVKDYGLNTLDGLNAAAAQLEFRPGSVEFKSAWAIAENPKDWKDYITARAVVPIFKVQDGKIVPDGERTRTVTVAMIALHVVGVIEGHPEFIWATFEHVHHKSSTEWIPDNAPVAVDNPDVKAVSVNLELPKYLLYPNENGAIGPATPASGADMRVKDSGLTLDAKTQKFLPLTPVYRMFPSSQATDKGATPVVDPEISSLNRHVREFFESHKGSESDVRSNYQLVGAVWLNTPRGSEDGSIQPDFGPARSFSNVPGRLPVLGGEDHLSSTAMESFTQSDDNAPNCFSCHTTEAFGQMKGSRLNVSHMLSRFFTLATQPPAH